MKRFSFIIALIFASTIQLLAQAQLTANMKTFDFGQVEWNKPVMVTYEITNTGNKPLYISNVSSSCACTVTSWTEDIIQPKEKGSVSVNFDAKALGKFYKEVAIYSNSNPEITYLNFIGEVVREVTDHSRSHPYQIGNLRLNSDSLDFGDVLDGETSTIVLKVANESSEVYAPILMHAPSFFDVKTSDMYLEKSATGEFEISFDTKKWPDIGYYQSELYLSRFIGDKVGEQNRIPFSFTVLPRKENNSNTYNVRTPKVHLSSDKLNLKSVNSNKHSEKISLTNAGSGTLVIYKVQTFSPAVEVRLKQTSISGSESVKMSVKFDFRKMQTRSDDLSILLLTNDPKDPKTFIRVQK